MVSSTEMYMHICLFEYKILCSLYSYINRPYVKKIAKVYELQRFMYRGLLRRQMQRISVAVKHNLASENS